MINQVTLIGHVGKDAEFKQFDNGSIANVTLATTEKGYTLQNGTKVPDRTDWHNLVFRDKLAEIARDYVKKGDKICVIGKLRYREYEYNGQKRFITEIFVSQLELPSPKGGSGKQEQIQTHVDQPQTTQYDMPF